MRVIISGTRTITELREIDKAIRSAKDKGIAVTEVVHGNCIGVDKLAEKWAKHGDVPVKRFPADWNQFGRSAGPRRNSQMATYADALIAVWDGESRGTADMITKMKGAGKPVFVHICKDFNPIQIPI